MKSVLVLLIMSTKVIAWEQIYAINIGGYGHNDSDGIVYQADKGGDPRKYKQQIDIGTVPESDRNIYQECKLTNVTDSPLTYEIPLKSDGLYVLIAKFAYDADEGSYIFNLTLNNDIQLLTNADGYKICGGRKKSHDEYFYICVSDNALYYKNQATLVRDERIQFELRAVKGLGLISGLVLLRGVLSERHKLLSSNTNQSLYFDPTKMNSNCLITTSILKGIRNLQEEQRQISNKFQKSMEMNENSLKNISILNTVIQSSIESTANGETQDVILREIQGLQKEQHNNFGRIQEIEQNIKEGNRRFEKLETEFKINIETLQADIKLRFEEVQSEQASMKHQISAMGEQLVEILNLLLKNRTHLGGA
jgi:Malectin domain